MLPRHENYEILTIGGFGDWRQQQQHGEKETAIGSPNNKALRMETEAQLGDNRKFLPSS